MYPNHHYKLVTMDDVKNLFNPNRKPVIVEEHIPLESNGVKICPSSKPDLTRSGHLFGPDCLIKDKGNSRYVSKAMVNTKQLVFV